MDLVLGATCLPLHAAVLALLIWPVALTHLTPGETGFREMLYSVGLWGQLGSKKPQTRMSIVFASFGQESPSVLCV